MLRIGDMLHEGLMSKGPVTPTPNSQRSPLSELRSQIPAAPISREQKLLLQDMEVLYII